jgi:hypothetical protein
MSKYLPRTLSGVFESLNPEGRVPFRVGDQVDRDTVAPVGSRNPKPISTSSLEHDIDAARAEGRISAEDIGGQPVYRIGGTLIKESSRQSALNELDADSSRPALVNRTIRFPDETHH